VALRADDVDLGRDRALVEQHQAGDIEAFEDLYRRYYGRLFRYCLRRTGNPHDAEEVTQEAFARAYRAMPALRGERRFYPWLSVIASRLCIDSHRRLGRTEPSADVDAGTVEFRADRLDAAVDRELLEQALARLTGRHREVLELRERCGWSYQRIAEHYDLSMGAVEGLLFRARHALRREFLAVAGPEAGLAGALPPIVGVGWLGRRLAGFRTRMADWAAGVANVPALAANGVGLAVIVTTAAAGLSAVSGTVPRQADARNVSTIALTAPAPPGTGTGGSTLPASSHPAAAGTDAAHLGSGQPAGGSSRTWAEVPETQSSFPHYEPTRKRAEDTAIATQTGPVVVGLDPDEVAAGTAAASAHYAGQAQRLQAKEDQP
jgi:RNA polymerase sigma-70 factor (ECF subfamily)